MKPLKCSTSLWSADLSNLGTEIRRVEPHSDRFHLDVADGHYSPTMLFFPDLVEALRPHTDLELEVHLMTTDPLAWIGPFAVAGANLVIFCLNSAADPAAVVAGAASAASSAAAPPTRPCGGTTWTCCRTRAWPRCTTARATRSKWSPSRSRC